MSKGSMDSQATGIRLKSLKQSEPPRRRERQERMSFGMQNAKHAIQNAKLKTRHFRASWESIPCLDLPFFVLHCMFCILHSCF
jgi:hypothetical protein